MGLATASGTTWLNIRLGPDVTWRWHGLSNKCLYLQSQHLSLLEACSGIARTRSSGCRCSTVYSRLLPMLDLLLQALTSSAHSNAYSSSSSPSPESMYFCLMSFHCRCDSGQHHCCLLLLMECIYVRPCLLGPRQNLLKCRMRCALISLGHYFASAPVTAASHVGDECAREDCSQEDGIPVPLYKHWLSPSGILSRHPTS